MLSLNYTFLKNVNKTDNQKADICSILFTHSCAHLLILNICLHQLHLPKINFLFCYNSITYKISANRPRPWLNCFNEQAPAAFLYFYFNCLFALQFFKVNRFQSRNGTTWFCRPYLAYNLRAINEQPVSKR